MNQIPAPKSILQIIMIAVTSGMRIGSGMLIAMNGGVNRISSKKYAVAKKYNVTRTKSDWSCDCKDFQHRRMPCKHMYAAGVAPIPMPRITFPMIISSPEPRCTACGSRDFKKNGPRTHKSGLKAQRYKCRKCGCGFTWRPGFLGRRFDAKHITRALTVCSQGSSYDDAASLLEQDGISVHPVTIYRWVRSYGTLVEGFMNGIEPQVGDVWNTDEIELKIKGKSMWLMTMIDGYTRFWLSYDMAVQKTTADATLLFREARSLAGMVPSILISDGLSGYHSAYIKIFAAKNPLGKLTMHIRDIHIRNQFRNNNVEERFNGTLRARIISYRGLKKADSPAIRLFRIYYNHVRRHGSLGMSPGEAAGIRIEGCNKWIPMIENAAVHRRRN